MRAAYVDTSCLVAIAMGERGSAALARRLEKYDELCASNLLEAELRAALAREGLASETDLLTGISWVIPDRPLSAEFARVLAAGRVRGADLWHLASALYLAEEPARLPFLTLDERQANVARSVGFPVAA